ncbi:hypothetical protein M413DRAFT_378573 [Hebeloma cylindrosporum]|uniref:ER-bound oxygenase mpaB/mpaB'/Rubber oxygenase catalytic domain-containing protein n=1 Tax=Hebeloma cylindrosporum TaxID=76867 RepID=A0A0C3C5Z1_HEBCY|nr:hypothetical protein M413DRAFT_378573 [Hebeloma cylindrosporum h7]
MDALPTFLSHLLRHLPSQAEIVEWFRHIPPLLAVSGGILFWLALARAFRWRRYNAMHRKYGPKWSNGKGIITPEEAQDIMSVSTRYDMPMLLNYALAFALFKTYGIPSISKLLASTKELKSKETVSKRYADTELLIATWVGCPISGFLDASMSVTNNGPNPKPADDPRAMLALARTNWLHSKYRISNEDYLYTLSLFILEPGNWAKRFGWRKLSPLEEHAYYVFWVEIGNRMGIRDIPDTLEELINWSKDYEESYMVPADTNKEVAGSTVEELISFVPETFGVKALSRRIVVCLMEDPVRESMLYPEQPWLLRKSLDAGMGLAAFVQRWFLLPRSREKFPIVTKLPKVDDKVGCPRLHPTKYTYRPWYRPEPMSAFGVLREKLLLKLGVYSEMPGPHLKSSGYRLEEMGPLRFENDGHEEIMRRAAELQGCPIAGPWSMEGRKQQELI